MELNRRDVLAGSLALGALSILGLSKDGLAEDRPPAPEASTQPLGQAAALAGKRWAAHWIGAPHAPATEFGVYQFRQILELSPKPDRFIVHVSGDNRYQLYVNGHRVVWGPARGDLAHWRFESVDLAPHLHAGRNVLAAIIWNFANFAPDAQISSQPAFLLQGEGTAEQVANTGPSWKAFRNEAYSPIRPAVNTFFVAGPGERINGSRYPWGWQELDFDDSSWSAATNVSAAQGINFMAAGAAPPWQLTPRPIPLEEEKPERLRAVRRSEGPPPPAEFPASTAPFLIPANTKARYLLDQTYLTTGYPELVVSGGRGATIQLRYAEALMLKGGIKNNRNEIEGKQFVGYSDEFHPDGGEQRVFRPLWWRTWRYMELVVESAAEPVTIEDLKSTFVGYPFEHKGKLETDEDPGLARLQEVGWRTARLCAHETYMDCPYYEQLQYLGDARIQALVSLFNSGDGRLARNLLDSVSDSRNLRGATLACYPTRSPNYIPSFSLIWIGCLHDYSRYVDDAAFVRKMMPAVRDVLSFFDSIENPDGTLGPIPWWRFMDWVGEWQRGAPPQEPDGRSSCFDFLRVMALNWAADLEGRFGIRPLSGYYRERAKAIGETAQRLYWDAGRRLYSDTPRKANWSQHANVLAVLAGVAPAKIAADLTVRVMNDKSLPQCSIYFRHYLFTALHIVGQGDHYLPQLAEWRETIDKFGMTTFPEVFDTPKLASRSDCHAWSASPNYELLHTVLGVDSAGPGFSRVVIRPFPGKLNRVSGSVPHPKGMITVALERSGAGIKATVTLPPDTPGEFVWKKIRRPLRPGANRVTV